MQLPTRYKYIIGAVLLLPIILYFLKYKDVLQIQNDASTKSGTTVPGKTANIFNNNNLALNSCNEKLSKCANKLRIVVINTDSTHAEVRRLIGSLHHYHRGDVKAVIYGIDLSPARVNEVLLWEHVEYIDLEQEFISAVRIDGKPKQHQKVQAWKPLVIKHSVDVFGKILYVDSDFIFQSSILGSPLLQQFETNGYYFAGEKCHENMQMQVYSYNSAAYNDILVPLVECSRRQCSKEELKLSEDPSKQYPCQNIPELVFRKQGIQPNEDKREVCTLIMREDFITSVSQLPGTGSKSWQVSNDQRLKDNNGKIHIAIGFPSTTNGNANPNLDTIPVFRVLVSSFLQSIEKNANGKYIYSLYLAFDESDAYYNKPENQKQIMDRFNDLAKGYPVQLILLQCVDSNAWVPFLWNVAFQHAMDDGADYFYQLNDDVRIETPNWSDVFVNALRANPFKSNFGATGPLDIGNQGILTQAFVSRTHYNIFGFLYPYVFKNWFSDDWVTKIYEHLNSNLRGTHETMKVHNSQSFGTRYFVCDVTGRADLAVELDKGKKRIEMWLKENK